MKKIIKAIMPVAVATAIALSIFTVTPDQSIWGTVFHRIFG